MHSCHVAFGCFMGFDESTFNKSDFRKSVRWMSWLGNVMHKHACTHSHRKFKSLLLVMTFGGFFCLFVFLLCLFAVICFNDTALRGRWSNH